jgi:hypothetical protein
MREGAGVFVFRSSDLGELGAWDGAEADADEPPVHGGDCHDGANRDAQGGQGGDGTSEPDDDRAGEDASHGLENLGRESGDAGEEQGAGHEDLDAGAQPALRLEPDALDIGGVTCVMGHLR